MSKVVYEITIRYRSGLAMDATNQIQYVDNASGITHTYEIQTVLNTDAANRVIVLMCYERSGKE